jgi:hypothetical protein
VCAISRSRRWPVFIVRFPESPLSFYEWVFSLLNLHSAVNVIHSAE